jgi:DNA-binding CsgD family transcriptional regulator
MVESIYDGAIDHSGWHDALLGLADLTGCAQVSMDIYDRSSGLMTKGCNPRIAPEFVDSYVACWRHRFSFWKRMAPMPIGKTLSSAELFGDSFWAGAFYNEWALPQGLGRDGRYMSVAASNRSFCLLRACKPSGGANFSGEDERLFLRAARHFIRAMTIHRRLRLAEAQQWAVAAGQAPAGFIVVDAMGGILAAHQETEQALGAAGLISARVGHSGVAVENAALKRLVAGATTSRAGAPARSGEVEHRGLDGALLRISIVPISQSVWVSEPWIALDGPAALVSIRRPEDAARNRISRLTEEHGLTAAEAAVAIETAKGDGRAAVAARLGIRETTVRSHLSAIFDKLDIHRQAELARLVSDA